MSDGRGTLGPIYVRIAGADAPDELARDIIEISIESSLHLPDMATIVLYDTRRHWIDERLVSPGTELMIAARGANGEEVLFDGEIVELEPEFEVSRQYLTVRAFDRLHRLARGRHVRTF